MISEVKYYIGTDLKFSFTVTADGFNMDEDDYEVVLICGGTKVTIEKDDVVTGTDTNHYLLVDTTLFPSGTLRAVVYAKVPDSDYVSEVRREVAAEDLVIIKHPW